MKQEKNYLVLNGNKMMNKQTNAKIAFYKAKGNLVDKVIRLFTVSPYSHCEIVIGKNWYSSSPRDNGVRVKQIQKDLNKWDFIEVDINKDRLYEIYRKYKGCGYDFKGIFLSNILGLKFHSKNKVTCSEFCAEVLGLSNPNTYSPGSLYKKLIGK